MTQDERRVSGLIYDPLDGEIMRKQQAGIPVMYDFNATEPEEMARREILIHKMLGAVGEDCYIEPPFHANWGGKNVFFGSHVYANFNLTAVDDAPIIVGDYVMFGPNVTLVTANHPIDPNLRRKGYQYVKEITIENNVWIGAGAILLPGVRIGENAIVGAGSVVSKDIPKNTVAVGNPCRVIREITELDSRYFDHGRLIDYENL